MKYPNLRYGNPNELAHYAQGIPIKALAKRLRRSERCIKNYLSGAEKIPWWVPEILRLQKLEHDERMYQMRIMPVPLRLGLVTKTATVYQFSGKEPPPADPLEWPVISFCAS